MLPILLGLFAPTARAEAVIEFKTKAPVQISVDGRQAALQQNLRQRVAGLDPGVHELKVSSMFGKTLYEAEIEIPDNTLTTAAWERGQITVISTDWLEDDEDEETAVVAAEEPGSPSGSAPAEALATEDIVVPPPPVAEDLEEVALAVPAAPAVAAAPVEPPAAAPIPVATAPVATEAMTLPSSAKTRTLTVNASDGMRIDVVHEGRTVTVVVEGDTFRIVDASGMELALGAE